MKTRIHNSGPLFILQSLDQPGVPRLCFRRWRCRPLSWLGLLVGVALLLMGVEARADRSPEGCLGSGLGISLYTSAPDVHVGDTLYYSANVFNTPFPACDAGWADPAHAGAIEAYIVTPNNVTNKLTLRRTFLAPGDQDFYTNVVSYVVRAQDIQPDGTLRAIAFDRGDIHQNELNSTGGGFQGVNTVVALPCIRIAVQCVGSTGETGVIEFTGTVTNCGNVTLTGVTVENTVDGSTIQVATIGALAVGQSAPFSGSWTPQDPCNPSTATLTATGTDSGTASPKTVTSSANTTCAQTLAPGIRVTKVCPAPVAPGQDLIYSGTVENTGNVTLTNIVVVNNQPAANTVVFTLDSLAPGATANFTGSYKAPAACSVTDTVTATARSRCGVAVNNSVTTTCPIVTTPLITVTAVCPTTPVTPGGTLAYRGTVHNGGDVTLSNVVVVSDRPVANTVIFTAATLAPNATAEYTASFTAPTEGCTVATTVTASGRDACNGNPVSNNASITCPITTAPGIVVTLACPAAATPAGAPITYSGTVRNSGNVTLNNVTVVSDKASPSTVLSLPTLAVGASANFTASFTAPADACSVSSSVVAAGLDACTQAQVQDTETAICALITAPKVEVTYNCPTAAVSPGGVVTYTGVVRNLGDATLTNVVVLNDLTGTTPVITIPSLAPQGSQEFTGSFTSPANACVVRSTTSVSATSLCGQRVTHSQSLTCPLLSAPQLELTTTCSTNAVIPGGQVNYSGTIQNTGNITLSNVVVVSDRPAAGTILYSAPALAPGVRVNFTGSYTAPTVFEPGACSVTANVVATATNLCGGAGVTQTASATCVIVTAPAIAVTLACPTTAVVPGEVIVLTGTVRNTGNVALDNVIVESLQPTASQLLVVPSLDAGASTNFTASFTTPLDSCSMASSVKATGSGRCSGTIVTAENQAVCPLVTAPALEITQDCGGVATAGGLITYNGMVWNRGNVTLTNVVVSTNTTSLTTAGMVGHWALDETSGTIAVDGSGNGNNGTEHNVTRVPGKSGNALRFNGANSYVDIPNAAELNFAGPITISAWIIPNSTSGIQDIVAHGYTTSPAAEVVMRIYGGRYEVGAWNGGSTPAAGMTVPTSDLGKWVHLAGVYNGFAWTLYRNGVAVSSVVSTAPVKVNANWTLGARSGGTERFFNGVIDDVRLFNRALSAAEIAALIAPASVSFPAFTVDSLAPNASAPFSISYEVPANSGCSFTSALQAAANDKCTGARASANVTTICPLVTAPAIQVTHNCPATPVEPGAILTYSGSVHNPGTIALTNVVVVNNRPAENTVIFTAASLAPGATATFTGSYQVPLNCCDVWSTVTATGNDACSGNAVVDSDTTTCPVLTLPKIVVTKVCPTEPVVPGGVLQYSGTVSNAGTIALVNVTVVNSQGGEQTAFGPITLAPHESVVYQASYIVPTVDFCGTDTVTAQGYDVCTLAPVSHSVTTTCPILTAPRVLVTMNCPAAPTERGGVFRATGTVHNPGNVTLTDVVVMNSYQVGCYIRTNALVAGPLTLAPNASVNFDVVHPAPTSCCEIRDTLTATGLDRCTGARVTSSSSQVCPLLSMPNIAVSRICPSTTPGAGGLYVFTGTVTNTGDVNLTNVVVYSSQPTNNTLLVGPIELAPGQWKSFAGSYTVAEGSDPSLDTVTAQGLDICQGRTVIARANCSGSVQAFVIQSVAVNDGVVKVSWASTPGVTYCLQYKDSQADTQWTTLPGTVKAAGPSASKDDTAAATQRFYRVMVVR